MGLSAAPHRQGENATDHGPRRHDAPGKTQVSETPPGMEMHGQVGGPGGTRNQLEDERIGRPTIQGLEDDPARQQGPGEGQGDEDHRGRETQSEEPLGERQMRGRLHGWVMATIATTTTTVTTVLGSFLLFLGAEQDTKTTQTPRAMPRKPQQKRRNTNHVIKHPQSTLIL